jgi:hypothetical protein
MYHGYSTNYSEEGAAFTNGVSRTGPSKNLIANNIIYGSVNYHNTQLYWHSSSSASTLRYNNVYGASSSTAVYYQTPTTEYSLPSFQGQTWGEGSITNNNVASDPVVTGGTLPNGLDANYHPNTSYFALTASSPSSLKTTSNAISGDATHGYSSDPNKFAADITGAIRTNWSMGAYEYIDISAPEHLKIIGN